MVGGSNSCIRRCKSTYSDNGDELLDRGNMRKRLANVEKNNIVCLKVAKLVPGKSASECRAKSFESVASPVARKASKKTSEENNKSQIPIKLHRAGSNLFKKQVRNFVQEVCI